MVSLAKRLEGKPFHLIASHCQNQGTKQSVIEYVREKGLSAHTPNVTITKQGRHPDVKGNGYVPYYAVFDHRGKLVHHHMCGDYHGGDGLKMIEWVDRLVDEAPAIYFGETPFAHVADLAAKVASGKKLSTALRALDAARAAGGDEATVSELTRLHEGVTAHRDSELDGVRRLMATQPSALLKALKQVQKSYAGSSYSADVDAYAKEMAKSAELKASVGLEKKLGKILKAFDKLKDKQRTPKAVAKAKEKLQKLLEGNEALPYAATIKRAQADLG